MAEPPSSDATPKVARTPWARTTLWVSLALILVGAAMFVFKSCLDAPGRVVRQTSEVLATVAAAFSRGAVTNEFLSYATTLTNNLHLQIATLEQMELFTHTEVPSTAFGYVPLPDVVVEARVPAEFTYYLDLNAPWRFVLQDNLVTVQAPPIRFNRPAVDVSGLTYEVKRGFLKTDVAMETLRRSISSLLVMRARENIHLVRETGRRQTAEFVQQWLMRSFTDGHAYPVKVHFGDEAPPIGSGPEGLRR